MSGTPGPSRRRQVLAVLRESTEPLSLLEVANTLGVHVNTVRFHVERLLEAGQVEQASVATRGAGRPAIHYRSTRQMDPAGPRHYRMLAEVLIGALGAGSDRQDRAVAAGRDWGRRMAQGGDTGDAASPAEHLVALLHHLGFAPERRADGAEIALRHCPFLELASDHADVVCPVHLGLMQGALESWDADVTATGLEPFVEPDLCVAHLGPGG